MEAFSDGVLAIILTIMVLELKVPHGDKPQTLLPLIPIISSYVLSFIYIGIYWNNHHHLLHAVQQINGKVLWANNHLLFWLSLVPFVTGWMGENNFTKWPVMLYGTVLLMAGVAYYILERQLVDKAINNQRLAKAVGWDKKGIISVIIYAFAIVMCFFYTFVGLACYIIVALVWLIPDRRIEREIK